jgi:hypothetical protein
MSGIERFVAALFLAGAVAGAAAFGHKLGSVPAPPAVAVSLLPTDSAAPSVAIEAQPAPPLPPMFPALKAHRPLRITRTATPRAAAPVVRATTPALPARPTQKPLTILHIGPRAPQPDVTPTPAAPKPATPVAAPAPAPPPTQPVAAPATPAPTDVQVVLAATEQVVAPVLDQQGDNEGDNHDHQQGDHGWSQDGSRGGGGNRHGEHGHDQGD